MSDTDSFIEEVTEEVRRDRLFLLMKKYGWIAILLVILLVGGAAYNEYRKTKIASAAQKFGDEILTALNLDDAGDRSAALDSVASSGEQSSLVAMLAASEDLNRDKAEDAISKLEIVASDATLPTIYRHVAELKVLLLLGNDLAFDDRMTRLMPLAVAGAPFRLLAEEQMAMAEISQNNNVGAITRLQAILADGELTVGLRRRATQLIVALGGELVPI